MDMMYTDEDVKLLIAETNRGNWTTEGVLNKQYWVASPDNILCEYLGAECTKHKDCHDCMTCGIVRFIEDQDYYIIRRILERIKLREALAEEN